MGAESTGGSKYHQIIISDHARIRMRERRISEQQVVTTIDRPDVVKAGANGRRIAPRRTQT